MAIKDVLAGLFNKGDLPPLPDSFIFGVATADHQCEAFDPKFADIRDLWEEKRDPKAARRKATDFWNRYYEDIYRASKLGCTAFRFSIAWSRIEPKPGQFNQEAFEHYESLIEKIISCGMQPILTLHHFTWPVHVQDRGGMIADDFPDIYASYVSEVAKRFARDVPYWITFNEPNLLMGGYLKPWWDENYAAPPGLPEGTTTSEQVDAVGRLIRNLFLSHKRAYDIIKAENPRAKVGVNQYFYGLPSWLQQLVNRNAAAIKGDKDLQKQTDRLALKRDLIRGDRISRFRANVLEKDKFDIAPAAPTRSAEREASASFSDDYFTAGGERYAVAIARGDRGLLEAVNSAVRDFNDSAEAMQWRAEYEKTTAMRAEKPLRAAQPEPEQKPVPARVPIPKAPTGTVLRRIQDRGYIVVAVREDLPGFGYRNPETGKLEGLDVMLAHALAERILGDAKKVRLMPMTNQKSMAAVEQEPNPLDWILRQYTILSTIMLTNWWYMGMAGELDEYLCPPGCKDKMDFVGLDYYWGIPSLHIERLQRLIDAAYRRFDQAPVWPGALYDILKDLHKKFPDRPLIICENGSVKVADGWERAKYIQEHVKQVQRAVKDGIDVEAYVYWSITSNREWDLEFNDASDFGLYSIDLDNDPLLARKSTPASETYEQIVKNRRG